MTGGWQLVQKGCFALHRQKNRMNILADHLFDIDPCDTAHPGAGKCDSIPAVHRQNSFDNGIKNVLHPGLFRL